MPENLESGSLDTSSYQIEDLKKLLDKIGNISDSDFASLDENDENLSLDEKLLKEKFEKSKDQVEFIKAIINLIDGKNETNKEFDPVKKYNADPRDVEFTDEEFTDEENLRIIDESKKIREGEKQIEYNLSYLTENDIYFSENDIGYYIKHPEQIFLINEEENLIKVLGEFQKQKPDSYIFLEYINPIFRNNFDLLKKIENISFNYSGLSLLNKESFLNFENLQFIFEKTSYPKFIFEFMKQYFEKNELLLIIKKILILQKDDFEKEYLIDAIPENIKSLDKDNIMGLDEYKTYEQNNDFNKKITPEYIKKIVSSVKIRDNVIVSDNNIMVIDEFIERNGVKDIKDEIKILIDKGYFDTLINLRPLLEINVDLAAYAVNKNTNNMIYLPYNLRLNDKIISTLINSESFQNDNLEYIELNDIHSVLNFYKLIGKNTSIIGNKNIRYKIGKIIGDTDFSSLKLTPKEKIIIKELSDFALEIHKRGEELKKINERIGEGGDKNYEKKVKKVLENYGFSNEEINDIYEKLKISGIFTPEIYSKLLNIVKDTNKTKDLIKNLLELNLENEEENRNNRKKEYIKKGIFEKGEQEKLENEFLDYYSTQKRKKDETRKQFSQRIILEFIKNNNIDEKNIIDILSKELETLIHNKKIKDSIENIDTYISYLSGEITIEEYENQIDENIDTQKLNDKSNNYILTNEDNYIVSGEGIQIKGKDGKIIEGLVITSEEKNQTMGNPEATENLINFYSFFKELNLIGVWEYRNDLMKAVGDVNINPNDGNSIKDEELRKFGNKLLTFISNVENEGEGKPKNYVNLSAVNEGLRKFGGSDSMLSNSKTFNIEGEDKFTSYLRNQGIIGGAYFKTDKFRANLA